MPRPQNAPDDPVVNAINIILDHIRSTENISSDEKLARKYDVSDMSIYRWRRGIVDKSTKILVTAALNYARDTPTS